MSEIEKEVWHVSPISDSDNSESIKLGYLSFDGDNKPKFEIEEVDVKERIAFCQKHKIPLTEAHSSIAASMKKKTPNPGVAA